MRIARVAAAALIAFTALTTPGTAFAQLPAMRDRPLSAAERTRLQALEGDLQRISAQRNTSVAAVRAIARKLGGRLTTSDPNQLIRLIDERAGELATAKTRIGALERELEQVDSMRLARAVAPLLAAAGEAIEAGELDVAEARLKDAGDQFAQARGNLQARVDELSVREADILAQRAVVRRAGFDHRGAAELFGQAAALLPAERGREKAGHLYQRFDALFAALGEQDITVAAAAESTLDAVQAALPSAPGSADWAKETRKRAAIAQARYDIGKDPSDLARSTALNRRVIDETPVEIDRHSVGIANLNLADDLRAQNGLAASPALLAEAQMRLEAASQLIDRDTERRAWLIAQRDLGDLLHYELKTWDQAALEAHYAQAVAVATDAEPDIRSDLNFNLSLLIFPGTRPGVLDDYRRAAEAGARSAADTPRGGDAEAMQFFSRHFMAAMMMREYAARLDPAGQAEAAEAVRLARLAAETWPDAEASPMFDVAQRGLAEALEVQSRLAAGRASAVGAAGEPTSGRQVPPTE